MPSLGKVFYEPRKRRLMLDIPFRDRDLRIGSEDKVAPKDVPWYKPPGAARK